MANEQKGLFTGSKGSGSSGSDDVFRKVFEKIQAGIFIIEAETHTIVDVNPLAGRILGRSPEELIGNVCHEFICPSKCGQCPLTDLHHDIQNQEKTLINAKGEKVPVLKTVARVNIGGKDYLIESFFDIIDRKKAEERQAALISYLSESILRVKKPLELMQESFGQLALQAKSGDYDAEDIRMQLQMHANNLGQIVRNLEELQQKAIEGRPVEVPPEFREFFVRK